METAITSLIIFGILILAFLGLSTRTILTQANLTESSRVMLELHGERARTGLTVLNTAVLSGGGLVQVTLKNTGSTRLMDFEDWDVIVEYSDGGSQKLDWYSYGVAANQWNAHIYQVAATNAPEVFEPGILNPGEEVVVSVNLDPPVATSTTNALIVTTPTGITTTTSFTY
jgi:hypothetical protein